MTDPGKAHAADRAMARYAAGDDAAFAAVYDAVAPPVYAFVHRLLLGDHALAEDVVQQTLLNMHRARGEFIAGAEVMPWAYTIARRLVVDATRRRERDLRLRRAPETAAAPASARPDELVVAEETAASLRYAYAGLPAGQREALGLTRGEGRSLAEAATSLGTTTAAIKLRVHRALAALRAAIGKGDPPC